MVKLSVTGRKFVKSTVTIRGKAASADGISLVQYRVDNKGAFKKAIGTTNWHFSASLKKGKHTCVVRVTSFKGVQSHVTVKVARK